MGQKCLFRRTITSLASATQLGYGLYYLANAGITGPAAGVALNVANPGSGYSVNEVLNVQGGTLLTPRPAQLIVRKVDNNGGIVAVEVANNGLACGCYTATPANPVSTLVNPSGVPILGGGSTGGGSGATFTLQWATGIPPGVTHAIVMAETQNVRYCRDGTAPTATVGDLLVAKAAGVPDLTLIGGEMRAAYFIQTTSSASLDVQYMKN